MVDYKIISRHKNDISFEYGNGHKVPIKSLSSTREYHDSLYDCGDYPFSKPFIPPTITLKIELYNTNQYQELIKNIKNSNAKISIYDIKHKECIISYKEFIINVDVSPDNIYVIAHEG